MKEEIKIEVNEAGYKALMEVFSFANQFIAKDLQASANLLSLAGLIKKEETKK